LGGNVGAGAAEEEIRGQEEALAVDLFKQSVCGVRVVGSDVEPDLDEVVLGPGGTAKGSHVPSPA
jgi:hypothetical protein